MLAVPSVRGGSSQENDIHALVITRNLASGLSKVKHAFAVCERSALPDWDANAKFIGDGTSSGGEGEGKGNEGCLRVHCK